MKRDRSLLAATAVTGALLTAGLAPGLLNTPAHAATPTTTPTAHPDPRSHAGGCMSADEMIAMWTRDIEHPDPNVTYTVLGSGESTKGHLGPAAVRFAQQQIADLEAKKAAGTEPRCND